MTVKFDDIKITWTADPTITTTGGTQWIGPNYDSDYYYWPIYSKRDYPSIQIDDLMKRLRSSNWMKEEDALVFELPGVDKKSVELEVVNGSLSLKYQDRKGAVITVPDYKLDDNVDFDTLDVTLKDGLLLVRYQQKKSKKIKVNY
jgi:HSP20 family molecular chaperone IbpA